MSPKKFIKIKPSNLARMYSIFCKISLKSRCFFFLENLYISADSGCENPIYKILTRTDLYKSRSYRSLVGLMTYKNKIFYIILSSAKFRFNISMISTQPRTHLPLPKHKIATKRGLIMLQLALFLQKIFSHTPFPPLLSC